MGWGVRLGQDVGMVFSWHTRNTQRLSLRTCAKRRPSNEQHIIPTSNIRADSRTWHLASRRKAEHEGCLGLETRHVVPQGVDPVRGSILAGAPTGFEALAVLDCIDGALQRVAAFRVVVAAGVCAACVHLGKGSFAVPVGCAEHARQVWRALLALLTVVALRGGTTVAREAFLASVLAVACITRLAICRGVGVNRNGRSKCTTTTQQAVFV